VGRDGAHWDEGAARHGRPALRLTTKWADYDQKIAELKDSRGAWKRWLPTVLGTLAALVSAVASWFNPTNLHGVH
jgi:hypothetical protein